MLNTVYGLTDSLGDDPENTNKPGLLKQAETLAIYIE